MTRLLLLAVLAALVPTGSAAFEPYPAKPVRLLIGFPPGAAMDSVARPFAAKLSNILGQPVVVETRLGAGGTISSAAVARAPADGYTLGMGTTGTHGINASFYQGWETKTLRLEYGYPKSGDKKADRFSAHGSDALALAAHVTAGVRVEPGPLVIVDDRYRPVRRHLHDSNTGKGGKRIPYSRGTVHGLRKGLLIGTSKGKRGRLCGIYNNAYRYHDGAGKRRVTRTVVWVCTNYLTTTIASVSSAGASFLSGLKPGVL